MFSPRKKRPCPCPATCLIFRSDPRLWPLRLYSTWRSWMCLMYLRGERREALGRNHRHAECMAINNELVFPVGESDGISFLGQVRGVEVQVGFPREKPAPSLSSFLLGSPVTSPLAAAALIHRPTRRIIATLGFGPGLIIQVPDGGVPRPLSAKYAKCF